MLRDCVGTGGLKKHEYVMSSQVDKRESEREGTYKVALEVLKELSTLETRGLVEICGDGAGHTEAAGIVLGVSGHGGCVRSDGARW